MQDLEWPYLIMLAVILGVAGTLVAWEPVYKTFKDWQLKQAFRRRDRADRERARKA
jgi:hypothetical protein